MHKVLILDANQRSALAATRSLGKRGVPLIAADETLSTLAGSSRYCPETMVYPSPYFDHEGFIRTLRNEVVNRSIRSIWPMTEVTTHLVLKHRNEFSGISIPFATFEAFESLSNKWNLYTLAQHMKIPTPITHYIRSQEDLRLVREKLKFPVVLKPYRSRIFLDGQWIAPPVKYVSSIEEIDQLMANNEIITIQPFLIQEYIDGHGQGIFALYDQGMPIAFFAHRRLREKPPSGGVSVLSESIPVDSNMRAIAQKILESVQWHGIAMVEFKISFDGTPYLIEINARFWGSLQLAIFAGIDFPWLLYQLAKGKHLKVVNGYKIGVKNRWLLGDLDHLYLKLKSSSGLSKKWRGASRFLNFFDPRTRYEVNQWDDLRPFLFELKHYFVLRR